MVARPPTRLRASHPAAFGLVGRPPRPVRVRYLVLALLAVVGTALSACTSNTAPPEPAGPPVQVFGPDAFNELVALIDDPAASGVALLSGSQSQTDGSVSLESAVSGTVTFARPDNWSVALVADQSGTAIVTESRRIADTTYAYIDPVLRTGGTTGWISRPTTTGVAPPYVAVVITAMGMPTFAGLFGAETDAEFRTRYAAVTVSRIDGGYAVAFTPRATQSPQAVAVSERAVFSVVDGRIVDIAYVLSAAQTTSPTDSPAATSTLRGMTATLAYGQAAETTAPPNPAPDDAK